MVFQVHSKHYMWWSENSISGVVLTRLKPYISHPLPQSRFRVAERADMVRNRLAGGKGNWKM